MPIANQPKNPLSLQQRSALRELVNDIVNQFKVVDNPFATKEEVGIALMQMEGILMLKRVELFIFRQMINNKPTPNGQKPMGDHPAQS